MRWPGVIQPPDHDLFLGWLEDDPIAAIQALQALWSDDCSAAARLQAFLDRVPAAALGPAGERLDHRRSTADGR